LSPSRAVRTSSRSSSICGGRTIRTTSGSGLDPHITLDNAEYQLDRVSSKWATDTKRDPAQVRAEIEQILQTDAFAPLGGLVGEKMINVLQVNLELTKRYGAPQA
jgi:K+-transporting ATPase ATPase C chain